MVLFMITFVATVVVYFVSQRNMILTWCFGGAAILFYLIFRFGRK